MAGVLGGSAGSSVPSLVGAPGANVVVYILLAGLSGAAILPAQGSLPYGGTARTSVSG